MPYEIPKDLSDLPREIREELARVEQEKARRTFKRPLDYLYKPHDTQLRVHKLDPHILALFSANRFGKSLLGLAEIMWRCYGKHPYKRVPKPPLNCWIVVPDYGFFEETIMKGLWPRWGPRDRSVHLRRQPVLQFEFSNGSVARVMSQEMDLSKFMGAAVDYVWIDEQCEQGKFEEIMVRLATTGGKCLYTATLVQGLGWEYEQLWLPGQVGHAGVVSMAGALCRRDPSRDLEIGEPLLPPSHPMGNREAIMQLARTIPDPQMRDIRIFGEIKGRTGLILPFDSDINEVNPFSIPLHWPVWLGLDPGFYGFSVSFQTAAPGDVTIVWDELHSQRGNTYDRAERIARKVDKLGRHWDDGVPCFVDCEDQQVIVELNLQFQNLREENPHIPLVSVASLEYKKKALKAGISRMQWALNPDPDLRYPEEIKEYRGLYGCPHLLLFNDLRSDFVDHRGQSHSMSRHKWEIQRWAWKKAPEGHAVKDEPDDYQADGAHMLAAMRYGLMVRYGGLEPAKTSSPYDSDGHWYAIMKRLGQIEEDDDEY